MLVASLTLLGATILAVGFDEAEAAATADRGRTALSEPVVVHRALRLDGESALRLPERGGYFGTTDSFTVELWVRGAPPRGEQVVLGNMHYGGFGITWSDASLHLDRPTAWLNMSKVPGTGRAGYLLLRPARPWKTSTWTHLAFVCDVRRARLFVDGRAMAEGVRGGRLRPSDLPLYIGADSGSGGDAQHFFTGDVDDVRFSSVARYADDFTPPVRHEPDAFTTLLLDFEDPAAPYRDRSPLRHDVGVEGTPSTVASPR
jgi:hypothetical protein